MTLTGTDDLGKPVSATIESAADTGAYSFTDLRPGTYAITETQPAGYLDGKDTIGTPGGTATNDKFSEVALGAGVNGANNNFGELLSGSLSGFVYYDADNDGSKDTGEAAIKATVTLTGTDDLGKPVSATIESAADTGAYSFTDLRPGTYAITETQPAGYLDGKDTIGTPGGTATNDKFSEVALGAGVNGANNNFGELLSGSLSGFVYYDADNDGSKDTGEAAIKATVTLTGTDDLGKPVSATIESAADTGAYSFTDLRPGTYAITETQPAGYLDGKDTIGTPGGTATNDKFSNVVLAAGVNGANNNFGELLSGSLSGFVYYDADNDGSKDTGEAAIKATVTLTGTDDLGKPVSATIESAADTGAYSFTDLRPGTYAITETQPAGYLDGKDTIGTPGGTATNDKFSEVALGAGVNGANNNFGELLSGSLSGFVYYDADNDGSKDTGEAAIKATVTLTGTDDLGKPVSATIESAADTGAYSFTDLRPGTYAITETQPAGYLDGKDTIGTPGGTATNDKFSEVALGAGVNGANNNFGELLSGSLSGFVYYDADNDGSKDTGEAAIKATVTLTGTDDLGKPVSATIESAADTGAYSFTDLRPGTYAITETQPAGYLDGKDTIGTPGGTATNDKFSEVALGAGVNGANNNFGELLSGSLSGFVYYDADNDGSKDTGEAAIKATVTLTGTDDLGKPVSATIESAADTGAYSFTDLRPGTYAITETQPAGYLDGKDTIGTPGGTATNDKFSNVVLAAGVNGINNNFGELKSLSVECVSTSGMVGKPLDPIQLVASGGVSPYTYAIVSGNLPPGLQLASGSGIISGTPTTAGTYGYTVKVTDATGATATSACPGCAVGADWDFSSPSGKLSSSQTYTANGYTITAYGYTDAGKATGLYGKHDGGNENGLGVDSDVDNEIGTCVFVQLDLSQLIAGKVKNPTLLINSVQTCEGYTIWGSNTKGSKGTLLVSGSLDNTPFALPGYPNYTYLSVQASKGNVLIGEISVGAEGACTLVIAPAPLGSLSGFVYVDANKNGLFESGESPLTGVALQLLDGWWNPIKSTTTDVNGAYKFDQLAPGTYMVTETQPAGYLDGLEALNNTVIPWSSGGPDTIWGIVVSAGANSPNNNFGEFSKPACLSGYVYVDTDNDGIRDAQEKGIPGVNVTLTGNDDLGQNVNLKTTTAADGSYSFSNLRPSGTAKYTITETQPAGYQDGKDTAGTVGGKTVGTAGQDFISQVVLLSGDSGVNYNFGELKPACLAVQYAEGAGTVGIAFTATIKVTGGISPYTYAIVSGSLPPGLQLASGSVPGNGLISGTPTAAGTYEYTVKVTDATGATATSTCLGCAVSTDWDFSSPAGKLSSSQTYTANGYTITAYGYTDAGKATGLYGKHDGGNENGLGVDSDVDNEIGTCVFVQLDLSQLIAGKVKNPTLLINSVQTCEGYTIWGSNTKGSKGTLLVSGALDNTPFALPGYPNYRYLSVQASKGNVLIGEISAGAEGACTLVIAPAPVGSLSGFVYWDANNNGVKDAGECGLVTTVTLTGTDNQNKPVSLTTSSDSQTGAYSFSGLRPSGTAGYTITETQPAGYLDGKDTIGTPGGTTSNDKFSAVVLAAGVNGVNNNFGELKPACLAVQCAEGAGTVGIAFTATIKVTGGISPYTYAIVSGSLPPGLQLASGSVPGNGLISGTPTAAGTYGYTVKVTDATGATATSTCLGCAVSTDWDFSSPSGRLGTSQTYSDNGLTITAYGYTDYGWATALYGKNGSGNAKGLGIDSDTDHEIGTCTFVQLDLSQLLSHSVKNPTLTINSVQTCEGYKIWGSNTKGDKGTLIGSGTLANTPFALPGYPNYRYLSVQASKGNVLIGEIGAGAEGACTLVIAPAPLGSLSGFVYVDANKNGLFDSGENPLKCVALQLLDSRGNSVAKTTTDANGAYKFDQLALGTYTVTETQPAGYLDGLEARNNGVITGSSGGADTISGIVVSAGANSPNNNFGEFSKPCIGTLTIGYFKNHPSCIGPLSICLGTKGGWKTFVVGCQQTGVDVLNQNCYGSAANGITKLYAQLLAAKCNILRGAEGGAVAEVIGKADSFLAWYGYSDWSKLCAADQQTVLCWQSTLDDYNNGIIGPGHANDTGFVPQSLDAGNDPVTSPARGAGVSIAAYAFTPTAPVVRGSRSGAVAGEMETVLEWTAVPGLTIQVESSVDLIAWVARPAVVVETAPGNYQARLQSASENRQFFRIQILNRSAATR